MSALLWVVVWLLAQFTEVMTPRRVSALFTAFAAGVALFGIAAGAAMAANCEPCLNKLVPDLIEAGVAVPDIRAAVEIGQYVKDRPASVMKHAADVLAGTRLAVGPEAEGCPAEAMKQAAL